MSIERKLIEKQLLKKGFVPVERGKHRYFHHVLNGQRTGLHTFVSRGTAYRTIDDSLFSSMKLQLGLDNSRQVRDLLECPMSGDQYVAHLRSKGLIAGTPPAPPRPTRKR
jgi:hypothetical protein